MSREQITRCGQRALPWVAPDKNDASIEQEAVDDCQRVPGLKVLFPREVGKLAREWFSVLCHRTQEHVAQDYQGHSANAPG